jgi:hypothetical protein
MSKVHMWWLLTLTSDTSYEFVRSCCISWHNYIYENMCFENLVIESHGAMGIKLNKPNKLLCLMLARNAYVVNDVLSLVW